MDAFEAGAEALRHRLEQIRADAAVIERTLGTESTNGSAARSGPRRPAAARRGEGQGQGRRAKGQDLASVMQRAMSGRKPMAAAQVASAVVKSGYKSSSPAFQRIVAMRLLDKKRFRRVGRGLYSSVK